MIRLEKSRKIVLITNNFPPKVDGVGDYTYWLSRELHSRDHQLHIICRKNVNTSQLVDGINVHPIIEKWTAENYRIALACIMDIQADWVILQYVPYAFSPYGIPTSIVSFVRQMKQKGLRVFIFFHEFFIGLQFRSLKATFVALTQIWITKRLCRYADRVATSTDHYVKVLQQWRKDIPKIPIGSNIPFSQIKEATNKAERPFKIITFGLRNVKTLLHFFELMKKEIHDIELIVCGKQHLPIDQEAIAGIHFTGYLADDQVARYLTSADVFLLADFVSERGEGGTCLKSGSLAAAFAAGLPIIGMKGKMNDQLLQEMEAVQLVDYHQYDTWIAAVLKVYHQRHNQLEQRAAIRHFYEQHQSWKSIGDRYLEIINSTES
jgi:glycosyltransferase involved in cell wall biosynthesis